MWLYSPVDLTGNLIMIEKLVLGEAWTISQMSVRLQCLAKNFTHVLTHFIIRFIWIEIGNIYVKLGFYVLTQFWLAQNRRKYKL